MKRRIYLKGDNVLFLPSEGESAGDPVESDQIRFSITMRPESLSGYPGLDYPEREISIAVPTGDMPRVRSWFTGNMQGVEAPPSDTLLRNIDKAVNDLVSDYERVCASHNLFSAPSRFAWCAVRRNGSRGELHEIECEFSNTAAPNLVITNYYFTDTYLYTRVEIRNRPSRAWLTGIVTETAASLDVKGIEIYSTMPAVCRPVPSDIFGVRTMIVDGVQRRCWSYDRFSEEEVTIALQADSVFRKISFIPVETIMAGEDFLLPMAAETLLNFSKCERYEQGKIVGGEEFVNPFEPVEESCLVNFETLPIAFELPETVKKVRSVCLDGVFNRISRDVLRMQLYGSHNRENWNLLGVTGSAAMRGMYGNPFRWYKVAVKAQLRPGDFLEALIFEWNGE